MKQWIFKGALLAGLAFVSACGDGKEKEESTASVSKKLSNEESIEAEILAIEETIAKSELVASSLNYAKESGEAVQVLAYLSEDHKMLKLEEKFSDGQGKNNGKIAFYMKDKLPFATKEHFEDNTTDPQAPKFVERVSYYDAKGKVLATKEKRVNYEEELVNASFVSVPLHACSIDRAMRVLDQKDEFETTFQGFAVTEVLNYLIVGQPGDDGYSSTMRIEFEDDFIKDALKNQVKYLNRKCRVTFQTMQASSGFEYQVYTGGAWVE